MMCCLSRSINRLPLAALLIVLVCGIPISSPAVAIQAFGNPAPGKLNSKPIASRAAVSKLIAQLDSQSFREREYALRELVELGQAIVEQVLIDVIMPVSKLSLVEQDKLVSKVDAALEAQLFDHWGRPKSLEVRFRVNRVRQVLDRYSAERLRKIFRASNAPLSKEVIALVHGYTGGFRSDTTWFDAEFTNLSMYTVTLIRIRVDLIDKQVASKTISFRTSFLTGTKATFRAIREWRISGITIGTGKCLPCKATANRSCRRIGD